jgi:hypothetical protein
MSKTITLQFRDWRGFISFSEREYETMKEARKDLKEFAKDKQFFNNSSETPTGYEDCVEIRLIVNGEIEDCKATAWAAEIIKKYDDPTPLSIPGPAFPPELKIHSDEGKGTYILVEDLANYTKARKEENTNNDPFVRGWNLFADELLSGIAAKETV